MQAIVCHLNRRVFLPRKDFLDWRPEPSMALAKLDQERFQGWLARSYLRIAMPNELVSGLKTKSTGLLPKLREVFADRRTNLHKQVAAIFVQKEPDDELDVPDNTSSTS